MIRSTLLKKDTKNDKQMETSHVEQLLAFFIATGHFSSRKSKSEQIEKNSF